jgi:hypothetical protein
MFRKPETNLETLRILGGWISIGLWIDPCGAGSYNLMCSGSSLVFAADLPVWESGGSSVWWACS